MKSFLPVFPLHLVLYPGEPLNLHIFEPRYQQMIRECVAEDKPFGIPAARESQPLELGTTARIVEVVKTYDNGSMDIRTQGETVFEVLTTVPDIPEKLYSGAIVNYPKNDISLGDSRVANLIFAEVKRLYSLMQVEDKLPQSKDRFNAYDIAHLVGLSYDQEYELLRIMSETQRMEFLRRHLKEIAPLLAQLEEMKERVKRNGHFRELSWENLK
jgi:Lon protease-like protein